MQTQNGKNGYRWYRVAQDVAKKYGAELGTTAFAVYFTLAEHADNDSGLAYPSKARIAAAWGIGSRNTVDAAIAKLEQHEPPLLRCERNRTKKGTWHARYWLIDPFEAQRFTEGRPAISNSSTCETVNPENSSCSESARGGAQILRYPRAESEQDRARSARSGESPRAENARGDGEEWEAIRRRLGNLGLPVEVVMLLDGARVQVAQDAILIAFADEYQARLFGSYGRAIEVLAERVTRQHRPVIVSVMERAPARASRATG